MPPRRRNQRPQALRQSAGNHRQVSGDRGWPWKHRGQWIRGPNLIQPGSWYHLAFVIDQPNQTMKIYYNGVEAPLTSVSDEGLRVDEFQYNCSTSGPFTIGSFLDSTYGLKGHLDDMRVYNRVLSDEEIAKIAQEK